MHTGRPNGENSERMLAYADALTLHKCSNSATPCTKTHKDRLIRNKKWIAACE